ncbi:MAG: phosphoribosylamine--glycine ligase [Spirochaetes bacterium]|nr:phosphoribosylamine--glycine ligase [Spirochaetota bacterium]
MKILIVGSGGREHALAWKFAQSEQTRKVFVAPGNGGTALENKCENVPLGHDPASSQGQEALLQFALGEKIDFTLVGAENPLEAGIVDKFRAAGLKIIGPEKKAARLEASKIYAKSFMAKYGVRTASSGSFSNPAEALDFAREHFSGRAAGRQRASSPLVIKADGLAAGKGVVLAQDLPQAEAAVGAFMKDKSLGEAGANVLIEEFIAGKEVSVLAAVSVFSGKGAIMPFVAARDHKRRFDGGEGPNTGGMGAIAPVPDFSSDEQDDFAKSIVAPTLDGIKAEGFDYRGFIFFGLMVRGGKCYLLEYNARLGDPETQAVLPLADFDMTELCDALFAGRDFFPRWKSGAVCAPVAVERGYPGDVQKGAAINIDKAALEKSGAKIFFAGASLDGAVLAANGGRVFSAAAFGENAEQARAKAYAGLAAVTFDGMDYRKDIGLVLEPGGF